MTQAFSARIAALTALAMLAFAANSILNRLALADTAIDAASFTLIRIAAGALVLWLLLRADKAGRKATPLSGDWPGAVALFVYAAAFSFIALILGLVQGLCLYAVGHQYFGIGGIM